MIGGYQIIDLRNVDLEVTESAQSITNAGLLNQLLPLRDFIDKSYDFNKPLENQLKPVLIRFRDKKSGEKIEGSTYGELAVKGNYYTFQITARISGQYTLLIVVAFEEITDDYGNKVWVIDSATIQLADASNVLEGNIAIDGDLSVSGNATLPKINNEENPSVKPIYCHPIVFNGYVNSELSIKTCFLIFNNSATPFTKETFIAFLKSLPYAYFMTTGGCSYGEDNSFITSYVSYVGTTLYLTGIKESTGAHTSIDFESLIEDFGDNLTFNDGVNKIN